jgi:glycosyltransferase involved in cell wall biosynthesis
MSPALSLVLPACNEADNLEPLVAEILAVVSAHPRLAPAEILVVDDGSTDDTWS